MTRGSTKLLLATAVSAIAIGCSLFVDTSGLSDGDVGSMGATDAAIDSTSGDAAAGSDAQSSSDAANTSNYRATVLADAPIAYWRLGEKSGPTLKDETGNYDGDYSSTAGFGVAGAIANDPDTAINCDGLAPIASVAGDAKLSFVGHVPFSIELWAKPAVNDSNPRFTLAKEITNDAGRQGYALVFSEQQMNLEHVRDDNFDDIATTNLAPNVYSHVVFVFDGSVGYAYLNGAQIGSTDFGNSLIDTGATITLGFGGGYGFVGALDEIAIYDHALSAARVQAHLNAGLGL